MNVNIDHANPALLSLIQNRNQILPIDANILIPPDRSREISTIQPISFEFYRDYWIEPILSTFPMIYIHEAINEEIVSFPLRNYVDQQIIQTNQRIKILSDDIFNEFEEILRSSIERRIAYHTAYEPTLDNADDRGEVKSLAHIATRGLLYFCSHDSNALRLIEQAETLDTNLEYVSAIRTFEVIYYLQKTGYESKQLRALYKYLYYLKPSEKNTNPGWGDFITVMDRLYSHLF
jgi:hypothetical protein